MDAFWGDRYGQFRDPFGHVWEVATHKKDMTNKELESAAKNFLKKWETRTKKYFFLAQIYRSLARIHQNRCI